MKYQEIEWKEGINIHQIHTDKFKTNLMAIFLTTDLNREDVTKNALLPAVLRRGCKSFPSQEQISEELQDMYGASFDCGLDKTGDNQVLKFYMESVNDLFLPKQNETIVEKMIQTLFEIVFAPYLEEGVFKQEYVEQEKNNIKQIIEGKIDNKARYALDRCIEEMYQGEGYGLYKYGYVEDLDNINAENLYDHYQSILKSCKIDIFLSGNLEERAEERLLQNTSLGKIEGRTPKYQLPNTSVKEREEEAIVKESMDVAQGKLVIGLNVPVSNDEEKYDVMIYNSILGGSANSKLFQNVREKESLAYTASSHYMRFKNHIFINCGIEIQNFEKAVAIIKEQIEGMKQGDFTEEEIEDAKQGIIASIKSIDDEQDTEITYLFGQELSQSKKTLEEYQEIIEKVGREKVQEIANHVSIHTIYFLKD